MTFERVPVEHRPLVEAAAALVPARVRETFQPHFLIGISPRFVGLHDCDPSQLGPEYAEAMRGWTYDDVAHACYAAHFEHPTVVFPRPELYHGKVGTLLHEWGHLYDEQTGFTVDAPETSQYSRTNRAERVAEAFEAILLPPTGELALLTESEGFRPMREAMGLL